MQGGRDRLIIEGGLMKIKRLIVGPLEVNCYILWDEEDGSAVCIDPGGEGGEILKVIEEEGLDLKFIINTHGHFDHVGANGLLKATTGATIAIHSADAPLLEVVHLQSMTFGISVRPSPLADLLLKDGDTITFGRSSMKVIHTPGHTKGGISLLISDLKSQIANNKLQIVFTGDTLFAGSVGRTDLPGGDWDELVNSVRERLLPLGDDTKVFPGHGPETTIGEERRENPMVAT